MAHALNVLADPVRRRILEIVANSEMPAGSIVKLIQAEYGISQPAVSQHLKVLKVNNLTLVTKKANRRIYTINPQAFYEVDVWLYQFKKFWVKKLDDLASEVEN